MTLEFNRLVDKPVTVTLRDTGRAHDRTNQGSGNHVNRVNEDRNQVKQAFIGTAKLETFVQAYNRMFSQSDMHA